MTALSSKTAARAARLAKKPRRKAAYRSARCFCRRRGRATKGWNGLSAFPARWGGALVSNAGAYRGNIGPLVSSVRVFADGLDQTVGPEWMEFSYRDSRLRRGEGDRAVVLSCTLALTGRGDPDAIVAEAKNYQAQRRAKTAVCTVGRVVFQECAEQSAGREPGHAARRTESGGGCPGGLSQRSLRAEGASGRRRRSV